MNSPTPPYLHPGAPDALFDRIERALLALTNAPLDAEAAAPRRIVDEFGDDLGDDLGDNFPDCPAVPPPRGAGPARGARPDAGRDGWPGRD